MDNIDNIKKNNTKFIIFEIIVIMLGIIGVTFAVSYVMDSINVNVDTAQLAVDYTGSLTLPTANLMPITDDSVDTNNENVMRINFTVKGASSNPDITIIYDVILSDLQIDSELKSEYLKWELEKNGVVISSGSFSPWFDSMKDGKLWLTEIQQDLPNNSSTPDSYEFRIWISESCPGDISTCTEDMDQSNMLNKSISGKIETVLYTKGKEALMTATSSDHTLKLNTINNPEYYKDLMRTIWLPNLDNTTQKGLDASKDLASGNIQGRLKSYIQRFQDIMGNNNIDFTKPQHILNGDAVNNYTKSSRTRMAKFNLVAQSPLDLIMKASGKRYGNQKWLRIASGIGGAVFGTAILAQFGFGKIRNPQNIQKQVNDDANS